MRRISIVVVVMLSVAFLVKDALTLPSWTRRYGINCGGCHFRINRINQVGLNMYRMGFRTAHDDKETGNFGDYFNFTGKIDARGNKQDKTPAFRSALTLYGGGALSKDFSFLTEATFSPEGEQELADVYVQYTSPGSNYATVKFGQFLPLILVDNPVEVAADRGAPFPRERRYGAELGFSNGDRLWGAISAVQSADPVGINQKDLYDGVINGQFIVNDKGTTLGGFVWWGRYYIDTLKTKKDYTRFGVIGNYNLNKWLFSAGAVAGEGNSSSGDTAKTWGLYANIDYLLSLSMVPVVNIAWYDPDRDVVNDELSVVTASFFWWAADHIAVRPQVIYEKGKYIDTYNYRLRVQYIY